MGLHSSTTGGSPGASTCLIPALVKTYKKNDDDGDDTDTDLLQGFLDMSVTFICGIRLSHVSDCSKIPRLRSVQGVR